MAASALTPARALRRPRRVDPRALVGIFLTLAALGGSIAYWAGTSDARGVVVATRDLPAGATLRAGDLAVAYVRFDDALYRAALPGESLETLLGRELAEPAHAQQVLARAHVAGRAALAPDQLAVTVPARPDNAANGRLRPGDAVRVLATPADKTGGDAHTRVVLDRARVFDVGHEPSPSARGGEADRAGRGAISSLTLAVTAEQARDLVEARRGGELDVALLPPDPSTAGR